MKTLQRLYEHYKELKGIRKLIVSFLLNWIYWGSIYFLIYYVLPVQEERNRSVKEYLITVTIGAFFWTLLYSINYKRLFKKSRKDKNDEVSDTRNDAQ